MSKKSVAVDEVGESLAYGFEYSHIYMFHSVVDGVPLREKAVGAIGVHSDDVDSGYTGAIDEHMVVGDSATATFHKVIAKSTAFSHVPHLANHSRSILHGEIFL